MIIITGRIEDYYLLIPDWFYLHLHRLPLYRLVFGLLNDLILHHIFFFFLPLISSFPFPFPWISLREWVILHTLLIYFSVYVCLCVCFHINGFVFTSVVVLINAWMFIWFLLVETLSMNFDSSVALNDERRKRSWLFWLLIMQIPTFFDSLAAVVCFYRTIVWNADCFLYFCFWHRLLCRWLSNSEWVTFFFLTILVVSLLMVYFLIMRNSLYI